MCDVLFPAPARDVIQFYCKDNIAGTILQKCFKYSYFCQKFLLNQLNSYKLTLIGILLLLLNTFLIEILSFEVNWLPLLSIFSVFIDYNVSEKHSNSQSKFKCQSSSFKQYKELTNLCNVDKAQLMVFCYILNVNGKNSS